MQLIVALLIVALAAAYLIGRIWQYLGGGSQTPGCGSACGGCASGEKGQSIVSIQLPTTATHPRRHPDSSV